MSLEILDPHQPGKKNTCSIIRVIQGENRVGGDNIGIHHHHLMLKGSLAQLAGTIWLFDPPSVILPALSVW